MGEKQQAHDGQHARMRAHGNGRHAARAEAQGQQMQIGRGDKECDGNDYGNWQLKVLFLCLLAQDRMVTGRS